MYQILIILALISLTFSATYNVTPTAVTVTSTDIGFSVSDTSWQLQTVVDNYYLGGVTYGKTYWGTKSGEIGYYYWCGGNGDGWCYKTVYKYSGYAYILNCNSRLYAYIMNYNNTSTEVRVNYQDSSWKSATYAKATSTPFATKDGALLQNGNRFSLEI